MVNCFDIARDMARLADSGKPEDAITAEVLRLFPTATAADCQRALCIALDRFEMMEEECLAAAHSLHLIWFSGAPKQAIDAATKQYLKDGAKFKPSAETLFPKPDKSKS